ncbi:MAG: RICIN domain-containing protein [Clostridia bacterium]
MKKILSLCLALAMLLSFAPMAFASEAGGIPVYLDGERIEKDGVIIKDSTFLPLRALCEALGYSVDWDSETSSAIVGEAPEETEKGDGINIYLDGTLMEEKGVIVDSSTYLPLRALCEALGKDVEWKDDTREVYVSTPVSDTLSSDTLSGKYFELVHASTSLYLAVEHANTADGAKVVVAGDAKNTNQIWAFTQVGDGYYKIVNRNSGKSMDISAFSTLPGVEVTQYTSNGGDNQLVKAILNDDGTYTFTFKHSSLALTATERYTTQEELTGDDTQKFTLIYKGETSMGSLKQSDGYKALDSVTKERFDSFVYTTLPFGARVYTAVEDKLITTDYFNLSEEEQVDVLKDCLNITVYGQVDFGEILPDKEKAKYEIVDTVYEESYDVWRGTMLPVWKYSVKMEGDVEGQVHEWTMISTVEDSPIVTDAINALARFPYAIRRHIKRLIYRQDSANSYNGGGDTIWIRLTWVPNEKQIAHTLAHELGHVLDSNLTSESALWNRARENDMISMSSYGNSNREEDLAEFSRMYNLLRTDEDSLTELEKVYPNRFQAYAALLYTSDPIYYEKYQPYYENAMAFDDDNNEAFYCTISIPGTNLVLTAKDASNKGSVLTFEENTGDDNQIWRMREWQGRNVLCNKASGYAVNVPGNSTESGKNLIVWNGGKGDNELMTITNIDDDRYTLVFKHSNLFLGAEKAEAGAKAIQTDSVEVLIITEVE